MNWAVLLLELAKNKKGAMEVNRLVTLILLVVFVLLMLGAFIVMYENGNIFAGDGNICEKTLGFIGGCK